MKYTKAVEQFSRLFRKGLVIVLTIMMCIASVAPAMAVYANDDAAQGDNSAASFDVPADTADDAQDESGDKQDESGDKQDESGDKQDESGAKQDESGDKQDESGDKQDESGKAQDEANDAKGGADAAPADGSTKSAPADANDSPAKSASDDKNDADADVAAPKEEVVTDGVAIIGDVQYKTLQDAIDAAKDGDTITLRKSIKEKVLIHGKTLTIDLKDFTWTAKGGSDKQAVKVSGSSVVTIKNGTMTGGNSKSGKDASIHNDEAEINLINITFSGNSGEVVRNANGVLNITDSVFKSNTTHTSDSNRRLIYSSGVVAKTTLTRVDIVDNNMIKGTCIYSYGDSYTSKSKCELNMISCNVKNNTVSSSTVYVAGNTHLYLEDTTISGNTCTSTSSSDTAGLNFWYGWIEWKDSAVYDNNVPSSVYAKDMYIRTDNINGGSFPLPKDMKDHGTPLTEYKMFDNRYSYEFTEEITAASNSRYTEISVEKDDKEVEFAEYDGVVYDSITDAVAAMDGKPGTIKILKDAAINEAITLHDGIVLDLDGHTLSAKTTTRNILNLTGGELTVKNGSFTGGGSIAGCVIETINTTLTLEDLEIFDNKDDAIYVRFNSKTDNSRKMITVKDCKFKDNGNPDSYYVDNCINAADCSADISGCVFDGNTGAVRLYEIGEEGVINTLHIADCVFKNGRDRQLESYLFETSSALIENCEFSNNTANEETCIIQIEQKSYGAPRYGGDHVFKNCVIRNNSGSSGATINAETGKVTFENCLIEGNSAASAGAIEADPLASLTLINTVVKNNKVTGTSGTTSGGIALRSATYTLITPSINGSQSSSQNLGFYASSLTMSGGAIYNNVNGATSPSAEDLYVSRECEISVPEVKDMVDGDYDFSQLFWKDDAKTDVESKPSEIAYTGRYYSVGIPGGLKQVYVDGVDGDDDQIGTKESPVKTLEQAALLAEKYNCKNILVLNTVTIGEMPTRKANALRSAGDGNDSDAADNNDSNSPKTLELGDVALKRSPGFTGILIELAPGTDYTIKNTVIDGNAKVSAVSKGSLVKVNDGAKLTLDEGAVLQYNGYHMARNNEKGGAVYCLGDMLMLDGAIIRNNYAITGGGVCVEGGNFIMKGGLIDANTALWRTGSDYGDSFGGGVALIKGASMEMADGVISNNSALHGGGGVSLGTVYIDSVTEGDTITFVMTGGSIEGNTGYASGGGIYVQCCTEAYIAGGNINGNNTKNSVDDYPAYFSGGGIYVNGYHNSLEDAFGISHGKLYLANVEIANNEANWQGGAIAVCGAGNGSLGEIKGTVIYDNSSNGKGTKAHQNDVGRSGYDGDYDVFFDDIDYIYSNGKWTVQDDGVLNYESSLADRMLNGAKYNWEDENGDLIPTSELQHLTKKLLANTDATASDPDVQASVKMAKVHINNNYSASNGGGIGCNGEIYIGELPGFIDIPVSKIWDDEDNKYETRPESITVKLLADGEETGEELILSEENSWKGEFVNLPLKSNDKDIVYTVKEVKVAGYTDEVSGSPEDGFEITNTYNPPEEVEGEFEDEEEPPASVRGVSDDEEASSTVKGVNKDEVKSVKTVKTGDSSMLSAWIAISVLAVCALGAAIIRRRRSESN